MHFFRFSEEGQSSMITGLKINEQRKQMYYEKGYWTEKTVLDAWNDAVKKYGDREYVADDQGTRMTYAEVDDKASRLASWLKEAGVQAGDVVTFQFPNWAEFTIVYVAVLKVGAVMHPVPKNYNDADLIYMLNLVEATAFICPTYFHNIDYEQQAIDVEKACPSVKAIAVCDKFEPAKHGTIELSKICTTYEPLTKEPKVSSDDVAVILSTSGTTGKPKAALLTHNNMLFSEGIFSKEARRTEKDVMFDCSPLNHAVGFWHGLIAPMLTGGRSVLMQQFTPREAIELMNREGCTWTMASTPFIYDILKCIEFDNGPKLETLNLWLCGGAPVPARLVSCAKEHGVDLCEVYGSTESCPHVYVPIDKCVEWKGDWSGVPYPGIEIKCVDDNGNEVPRGVQGEELSTGPHLFVGYLNEPERTDRALDDDGWFHSGELGYIDEEGRLRINGRKKEIIIRGGENISAREIDDDLVECPGILDTATIGMPDERLGERICTFAVARDEHHPSLKEITDYLASQHVQKRLWPERVEYIDEIPKTPMGKVKRFELAEILKERMANDPK